MPDINQQKDCAKVFRTLQIALDHSAPGFLNCFRYTGIAIPRKIHKVHGHICQASIRVVFIPGRPIRGNRTVHKIKIDGLRLTRRGAGSCKSLPVHQRVDQRGFADVRFSGKRNFRSAGVRKSAGHAAYNIQFHISDNHWANPPAVNPKPRLLVFFRFRTRPAPYCSLASPGSIPSLPHQCVFQHLIHAADKSDIQLLCDLRVQFLYIGAVFIRYQNHLDACFSGCQKLFL